MTTIKVKFAETFKSEFRNKIISYRPCAVVGLEKMYEGLYTQHQIEALNGVEGLLLPRCNSFSFMHLLNKVPGLKSVPGAAIVRVRTGKAINHPSAACIERLAEDEFIVETVNSILLDMMDRGNFVDCMSYVFSQCYDHEQVRYMMPCYPEILRMMGYPYIAGQCADLKPRTKPPHIDSTYIQKIKAANQWWATQVLLDTFKTIPNENLGAGFVSLHVGGANVYTMDDEKIAELL